MHVESIVDFSFGIDKQALAVLHMLDREPDFADYENGFYQVRTETRPWYNGRERGFVLSMSPDLIGVAPTVHIAVFEHRNHDGICALRWETAQMYFNHPLEDPEIFEKAYGPGKGKWDVAFSVNYGEAGKMATWVYEQMAAFYKEKRKEKVK
jgi:hypothetical protein